MSVHRRPMHEDAQKQDKRSKFEGVSHPIQQKGCMLQWIVITIVLLISFCALGLSIGAFLDGVKQGNELKKMTAQSRKTASDVQVLLNSINASAVIGSCDECIHRIDQLDAYRTSSSQALNSLQSLFDDLNRTVHEVDTQYHLAAEKNYTKRNMMSGSVDFTAGCSSIESICVINHNNVGTPSASGVCETSAYPLEKAGFRNVNILCSIDNSAGETNPLTSTLNIYQGEVSCLCSLVALRTPTASVECRLTIQRCPRAIVFNI